ncbi:hypothetical protein BLA29_003204 [Euroglyphus maynei]|uniref:Uncharacterized protein n=1 Tax=Euroglyphus maynei TaxID=6958 RepID=A0A1Y3BBH2_EURMA|nr:hypothetical protein BLA29_003204 [Euroglyphus maynei]
MEQKFQPKIRTDKRLRLEIDELLADVNDFMWLWHGWPIWIYRKVKYAPDTVTIDDRHRVQQLLTDQMPDYEQLSFVRRMIETQLPESDERKNRIEKLDRAIANTEHGRTFLIELIEKIENLLKPRRSQSLPDRSDQIKGKTEREKLIPRSQLMENQKYMAKSWKSLAEIFSNKPRSFRSRQFIESLMRKKTPQQDDESKMMMKTDILQKKM